MVVYRAVTAAGALLLLLGSSVQNAEAYHGPKGHGGVASKEQQATGQYDHYGWPEGQEKSEKQKAAEMEMMAKQGQMLFDRLPDYSDPSINRRIKCSACIATCDEVQQKLVRLQQRFRNAAASSSQSKKKGRGPSGATNRRVGQKKSADSVGAVDVLEELESLCRLDLPKYGLVVMKNETASHRYSKDLKIARAQGNWVEKKVQDVCAEVMDEYEDDLMDLFDLRADKDGIRSVVCKGKFDWCTKDTLSEFAEEVADYMPDVRFGGEEAKDAMKAQGIAWDDGKHVAAEADEAASENTEL